MAELPEYAEFAELLGEEVKREEKETMPVDTNNCYGIVTKFYSVMKVTVLTQYGDTIDCRIAGRLRSRRGCRAVDGTYVKIKDGFEIDEAYNNTASAKYQEAYNAMMTYRMANNNSNTFEDTGFDMVANTTDEFNNIRMEQVKGGTKKAAALKKLHGIKRNRKMKHES